MCLPNLYVYHGAAVAKVGAVAAIAKVWKEAKYSHYLSLFFTPIAIESLGTLGPKSAAFLHELCHKIKSILGR